MLALRRQRLVQHRRYLDVHDRSRRRPTGACVVRALLEVLDRRADAHLDQVVLVVPVAEVAGEVRQLVQGGVELQVRDVCLEPANAVDEVGLQVSLIYKRQERALGISVGEHDVGLDDLAVRQPHPDGPAVPYHDPVHGSVGADLRAERLRGPGHRLRDTAHASVRNAEVAVLGEHVGVVVCDRHDRARRASVLRVLGVDEHRAHLRRLEVLLDEVLHVAGEQPVPDGLIGSALDVRCHLRERGRLFQEVPVNDGRGARHELLEPVVAVYVRRREARKLIDVALLVVPAQHVFAVRERLEAVRVNRMNVEAVLPEFQVVNHLVL